MPSLKTPSYCRHKATGQAVVRIDGRDCYLGLHGSEASKAEYDRLVAQWLANGRTLAGRASLSGLSINELLVKYLEFARVHYQRDGAPTGEVPKIQDALRPLRKLYGLTAAQEFGPLALKTVRQSMIDSGLARTTINYHIGKVRRFFKWAVQNELVPPSLLHGLEALPGLRRGRDGIRDTKPVLPVSAEHVAATLPHLTAPIRAMIELQSLTGARPGEVQIMRTGDLDRTGAVWVYIPERHKTEHAGRARRILIGARAQAVLLPWLQADPDRYLFSPAAAVQARNVARRRERKTPMTPSQSRRTAKVNPKRAPRLRYDKNSYAEAIKRACDKAGVPHWSPNRLRHSFASMVRTRYGLEAAQVILGHARADVTQVYAERDMGLAAQVIAELG